MSEVAEYWDGRFTSHIEHHSLQNEMITTDFFNTVEGVSDLVGAFGRAKTMLEVGCGSGQFCFAVKDRYPSLDILGVDISTQAIEQCNALKGERNIRFEVNDTTADLSELGQFDLVTSSNVLEHFADPYPLLDQMVAIAKMCLVLVPFKHYDSRFEEAKKLGGKGGAGHVFCFDMNSFEERYERVSHVMFETEGWKSSGSGEVPRQLAILLKGKIE